MIEALERLLIQWYFFLALLFFFFWRFQLLDSSYSYITQGCNYQLMKRKEVSKFPSQPSFWHMLQSVKADFFKKNKKLWEQHLLLPAFLTCRQKSRGCEGKYQRLTSSSAAIFGRQRVCIMPTGVGFSSKLDIIREFLKQM